LIPPAAKPEAGGSVPIGILTVDADLVVRSWDTWLAAATGIAAADAIGRPLVEVVPDLAPRGLLPRFAQVLATGEVQVLAPAFHHYLIPCPPRQPSRHFDRMQQRVTLGPWREGGAIAGVIATVEDVTARIDRERELADGLRADDWKVRRAAVQRLSRDADPDLFQSLIASLRVEHRDFNVLSSALQLLAASDVDLTGPLVALMDDPDPALRMQVALALGERQTAGAVDALIRALGDPDVNVRFHVVEALGRLRAADATDALADIAESDDFFLVFPAVDALARIHDARVVPRLIPLLRRPDITQPVADALGELGGAEAVAPLVDVLNHAGQAAPIARALARIHERYEDHYAGGALIVAEFQKAITPAGAQRILEAVGSTSTDDLPGLVTVLGWLRGPAVERALARLLGQASVRSAVIEAIVRRDVSAGIIDILVEQLRAEDADIRLAAIVALGRIGDRRAAPALITMLERQRAEIVAAATALARVGEPASFDALIPLLAHDDATVRQAAIGALNSLGHPDMASRVAVLLASPDPRVRESAVRIAGYFGYAACVDMLIERCADPDESVRRAAVEHLPFLDDPRSVAELARGLQDPAPRVRAAAAQASAHAAATDVRDPLLRASQDVDPWVRYYAVRSLGELREASALPRLSELAASDPAMHVRIAALETIGATADPAALGILLRYAADAEPDLAAAALRALGRVPDDRALGALKHALRSPDPTRRLAAVTGLRSSGSPDAVAALGWTAGADDDQSVMAGAVEALGAVAGRNGDAAARAIAALVALTSDAARRDGCVTALARLPASRVTAVAEGLSHPQPEVRRATIDVLARMRQPDASAALRTALDDGDAGIREAAVTALDRLGARGTARRFAQMAREDASRAVRRAAAAALGRATDAHADGDAHEDR
jgi:HEAT repeat protein